MITREKSLLELAREMSTKKKDQSPVTVQEAELAVAVINGEVTVVQAAKALGKSHSSVQNWLVTKLIKASRSGDVFVSTK